MLMVSCEWSGSSDGSFNSSRAGLDVNISGVYRGELSGGKAVANKSGPNVSEFTVFQNGNAIEVIDTNGQRYQGTVGAPGAVTGIRSRAIPGGTQIAAYQVRWSGKEGVANQNIEFAGIISVVAVTDIEGTTTTRTIANNNSNSDSSDQTSSSDSSNTESTQTEQGFDGSQTVILPGGGTGEEIARAVTSTDSTVTDSTSSSSSSSSSSTDSDGTTTVDTSTFELTEANSQFRLQGTWIEEGGTVSQVKARGAGAGRLVVDGSSAGTTEGVAGQPANTITTR